MKTWMLLVIRKLVWYTVVGLALGVAAVLMIYLGVKVQ